MQRSLGDPTATLERRSRTANIHLADATAEQGQDQRQEILPQIRTTVLPHRLTGNYVQGKSPNLEQASDSHSVSPLIRLKTSKLPHRKFKVLQQFECAVTRITRDYFEAQLSDLTDPTKPMEFAELSLEDVSHSDLPLLVPGCVFYWILGYETRQGGQITNVSEIRLRRNPPWSRRAIEKLKAKALETYNLLNPFNHDGKATHSEG
jgi:hypothetical protein